MKDVLVSNITIRYGDYQTILNELVKNRCTDREYTEKAMQIFGLKVNDTFIILNDDDQEEINTITNLVDHLHEHFHISRNVDKCNFADLVGVIFKNTKSKKKLKDYEIYNILELGDECEL